MTLEIPSHSFNRIFHFFLFFFFGIKEVVKIQSISLNFFSVTGPVLMRNEHGLKRIIYQLG